MTVWSGSEVSKFIVGFSPRAVQPNGVDLTVSEVYRLKGPGELLKSSRKIPEYEPMEGEVWRLDPGAYVVRYGEVIRVPENAVGIVLPRSSLLRMGATVFSALWDSGYEGRGIGLLLVLNPNGIVLEKGARIAQFILLDARSSGSYSGIWKGEGIEGSNLELNSGSSGQRH